MAKKRSRKTRRPGKRRISRIRLLLAAAVLLGVPALVLAIHLDVTLRSRFDGRLWELPSRIYSSALVLETGERFPVVSLVKRLERSGYGRTESAPSRPGQFARRGQVLDVHLRAFTAPGFEREAERVELRFSGDRLVSAGPSGSVTLEPELLATLYGPRQEERRPVHLEDLPASLVDAVLIAEDSRFWRHHGLDVRGILRAAWTNTKHGRIVQGGSTITQQTVKNLYLGQERTWWRKLRELPMAVMLDARYPKGRILEAYVNEIYLGQRGPVAICGFQAAARFYFGRDLRSLSVAEHALLAGLVRSPGRYNPFVHPERAVERRNAILAGMLELGRIDPDAAERAMREPLALASGQSGFSFAPFAVDFIRGQLMRLYSPLILRREGLRVYTTLDTRWQQEADAALSTALDELDRSARGGPGLEGALVVLDPRDGSMLALVGGRDYATSQFNRAVQARRQPGSCFKPLVYAAAFEQGRLTPASMLDDSPLELVSGGQVWRPANHDREFRGWVSAREALERSLNVPTVRAARQVGLDQVIRTAELSGIRSPLRSVPSLALGAVEVTPLELAEAYATLARGGDYQAAWIVAEVTSADGRPLARHRGRTRRAIGPAAAFLVNDVLAGVFERGTARSAWNLGYRGRASGKTGTTDDTRDAWFVAYDPEVLSLTWVGYDDNRPTGFTGSRAALPVWVDLMKRVGREHVARVFEAPPDVVSRRIDPVSGALAQPGCPEARQEWFASGTEPDGPCPLHTSRLRRWLERLRGRGGQGV